MQCKYKSLIQYVLQTLYFDSSDPGNITIGLKMLHKRKTWIQYLIQT